ncbi:glycosyltransferase [Clostridium felsineum]|uniref:Undecaprenyl-phosphate 4-deoxy-4-formamido-L-arabinose transferase n=1 Tax=Clostridium felsineum TaxID=36839 RepID=A0A1S8L0Y0_9CLOT|nr:glycosyltransferase [Clostridium felsineum]URZ06306.1 Undecaprenyl-phosphate 4-deoxy-4-formamido-L-arabinose transferase [Clostridium felsineum]URZ11341.1 Undecaprenyl-phosphate 4-deoxy-4-formamido-L-arabinose transferase [Clostridium felsineum]
MNKNQCELSVVMPVYNSEKYLSESIESILKQTYSEFEFIIVNDGSTDKSLDIINDYVSKDNRIKLISRTENKGMVYSLNEGLTIAKGKYLARMDADDISLEKRFEKQINYMKKNDDVDILASKVEVFGDVDEEKKIAHARWYNVDLHKCNDIEKLFLENCYIAHPSVMMKMSTIRQLKGYDLRYKRNEDYNLWLRAISNGYKISMYNEKLIMIRMHSDSKINRDKDNYENIKDIIKSRLSYIKEKFKFENINYVIWGASNGGNIALEKIEEVFCNSTLIGYIDKFKVGKFQNVDIYSPDALKKMNIDYVFIATVPGCKEAKEFLNKNNFVYVKDYLILC